MRSGGCVDDNNATKMAEKETAAIFVDFERTREHCHLDRGRKHFTETSFESYYGEYGPACLRPLREA